MDAYRENKQRQIHAQQLIGSSAVITAAFIVYEHNTLSITAIVITAFGLSPWVLVGRSEHALNDQYCASAVATAEDLCPY